MLKATRSTTVLFLFLLTLSSTAAAGRPKGHKKDVTPPPASHEAAGQPGDSAESQPAESPSKEVIAAPATDSQAGKNLKQATLPPEPLGQPSVSFFDLIVRPMGGTLLVCALAIAVLVLYRKYHREGRASNAALATVLLTLPLGDKRSVSLVKLGRQVLVLGNTPQSITFLGQFEEEALLQAETEPDCETARKSDGKSKNAGSEFGAHLKKEIEGVALSRAASASPQFDRVRQSLFGL